MICTNLSGTVTSLKTLCTCDIAHQNIGSSLEHHHHAVQMKLKECEEVLENDYFLAALKDDFVENARLFIFETYCRIHQCIDMRMLAGDTLLTATRSISALWEDCIHVCIPEQHHPVRITALDVFLVWTIYAFYFTAIFAPTRIRAIAC